MSENNIHIYNINMASILALAGGAIINALAFPGSNFMFSKLSNHGAEERKRHDLAVENLQKAQASWVQQRQEKLDFINEELQRERHAERTFSEVNEAVEQYYLATKKRLPALPPKPVLSHFYHPSEQQKNCELEFILGGLALVGYLIYRAP